MISGCVCGGSTILAPVYIILSVHSLNRRCLRGKVGCMLVGQQFMLDGRSGGGVAVMDRCDRLYRTTSWRWTNHPSHREDKIVSVSGAC